MACLTCDWLRYPLCCFRLTTPEDAETLCTYRGVREPPGSGLVCLYWSVWPFCRHCAQLLAGKSSPSSHTTSGTYRNRKWNMSASFCVLRPWCIVVNVHANFTVQLDNELQDFINSWSNANNLPIVCIYLYASNPVCWACPLGSDIGRGNPCSKYRISCVRKHH